MSASSVSRPPPSTPRPLADLVDALRRHLRLLHVYAEQAFTAGDDDYIGEVAGKLRVLAVVKGKTNVPLLIRLMDECQIKAAPTRLAVDGAYTLPPAEWAALYPADMELSLTTELDLPALTVNTSTGPVTLSKRQFVEVLAEKYGAAHEDWAHPEYLNLIRESELRIKGYPPIAAALKPITTAVLTVADHVLPRLTPEVVGAAEARRGDRS